MAEAILMEAGFVGRVVDVSSPDYAGALYRINRAGERNAKLILFPASSQDVSIAILFATR